MKGKLYTMLRIKREYELSLFEHVLWWMVEDAELDEYIRSVIELRDAGYIHEEDSDNASIIDCVISQRKDITFFRG